MSGIDGRRLGLQRATRRRAAVGVERHLVVAAALSSGSFPQNFNLWDREPTKRFDQLNSETCFAHAFSLGAYIAASLSFLPSPLIFSQLVRAIARAETTPLGQPLPALVDQGATDVDTFAAGARYGVVPMGAVNPAGFTDVTDATVNNEATIPEVEAAATHLVIGPYAVDPADPQVVAKLQASLLAGIPVWCSHFCDTAEMQATASSAPLGAPNQSDPNGGGHATLIDGWETVDGQIVFWSCGSWGDGYAVGGRVPVTSTLWIPACWSLWPMAFDRSAS